MRIVSLFGMSLAVAGTLTAQTRPAAKPLVAAAPVRGVSVEGVTEYTLANGLRVLLFPDASKPTTTVNITFLVGSRSEAYGESGMAHLLEHMVFKGSTRHTNIPQELSERGASPNGSTWYDRTNYFETFPAKDDNLRWALDLESDRMVHSFIAKKDLESEMTVVRNEFESGENSPDNILTERVMSTAFLWHNYGKSTIGPKSDLENVPIERLQGFYRKYYQPDNAVLVIAGKFEPATALRMVQQTFGAVPRPRRDGAMKIWPTYTLDPPQDGERTVALRRVGDVKSLVMAWHIPAGSHPDFAALDVLTEVLSSQPTGRLYRAAVETHKASNVQAQNYQLREPGVMLVSAQVKKEDDLGAAQDAIDHAIDSMLRTAPPTAEEVERGKASLLAGINLELTNSESVGLAFSEWSAMGDWRLLYKHRDQVKAVTPDDVIRVARAYLKNSNRTVGTFLPEANPDRSIIPGTPDVATVVAGYRGDTTLVAGEAFDVSAANIDARTKTGTLADGISYAFLPKTTRGGTVTVNLTLHFGTEQLLMNKGAAPDLAGAMLMRGTTQHTRQQMTDSLNKLQAAVFVVGGNASATASVTAKREQLGDALRLAIEMLRQPSFDPKEFELARQEEVTALESQRSEPQMQAVMAFQRQISPYKKGHPEYVGTIEEQLADLKAVTLDQARAFYHDFYGASHGQVAAVGDFDPDAVRGVLNTGLTGWKSPTPFARLANPSRSSKPLNVALETPDKANAMFIAGKVIPLNDLSADYPALLLANYLLGGGFLNSRLATRIRQKDGLSYGVGSNVSVSSIDTTGMFMTYAIYAPENRDKLERAFNEEMVRAAKDGFTDDEVRKAKDGWTESAKLERANDAALAGRLTQDLYLHRTMAASAQLEAKVNAVTPAQLQAAVARYLDPASMAVIKAGDFNKKPVGDVKP